ncbi:MAG: hypothetical protein M3Y75_07365 [Actinomycetota bacterium]|nr:hypothetical protein [Actinomycetota bacterium]
MLEWEHLETLGMLIFQPSRYLQRVVEHLSFLPAGGERWQREIQLRIPTQRAAMPPSDGRFIVSLGMFRRYRFPDFTVRDAAGDRLNFVTRRQHQHCITVTTIRQYLDEDDWTKAGEVAKSELLTLYGQLACIITDIKGPCPYSPEHVRTSARALMKKLGKSEAEGERIASLLEIDGELLARYTHYLCWVPADPGDTLMLSATYTMSDTVRVAGERRKALDAEEMSWWTRFRTRFYTSLGLFPVRYELRAPAHDHAGSYYFTIEPPEDAHVSLLDWGHDRSLEGESAETDCAYTTCHIHNGEQLTEEPPASEEESTEEQPIEQESISGAKISAFLRADPTDHAALIAVALLNLGLAYLAQRGEFDPNSGDSQQQWLLLAPTLVVALIAQHRRRYYSSVTRSVRIGLWIYLAINALFGASVAFDISGGDRLDDVASAAMAVFSLSLLVLLVASSGLFERWTNRSFRSSKAGPEPTPEGETPEEEEEVNKYVKGVRHYADLTLSAMIVVAILGVVMTQALDWGDGRRDKEAAKTTASAKRQNAKSRKKGSGDSPRPKPESSGEKGGAANRQPAAR